MKKNKKESIVVFEDWFRYARCLNDAEFREFMTTILNYYKTQEQPKFTGLMLDVWNDIIDDLKNNISKKQAKRDTMLANSKTNPKLNTVPDIGPDTSSNIIPTSTPDTTGMEDGRCKMVDDRLKITDYISGITDDILKITDDILGITDEQIVDNKKQSDIFSENRYYKPTIEELDF